MATVRFYLRDKKTNPSAIRGRLNYDGEMFPFTIGYSINPKNWNQKKQLVTQGERAADDINVHLLEKKQEVLRIHDELKREKRLSNESLERTLDGEKDPKKLTLYQHIENELNIIKSKEDRRIAERKQKRKYMHIRYSKCFERLKEFAKKKYRRSLSFDDIDLNFYERYIEFLRDYPLAENSINGEIKRLKRFLNLGIIKKIHDNLAFKSVEFKAPEERIKHVTLDEDELETLYKMNLSGKMENARDIFIIGCRTGLRVGDYWKCVEDAVKKTSLICIDETDKTGEPVYIPIHWQVREILDKYSGVPPTMTEGDLNEYVKALCENAGFKKMVKDTRKGRNKPKDEPGEYCPKYKLITTHTARRSCATNMYLAGFDLYFIQGILGHKKIETTIRYLGVTRELIAMKSVENPYFKKHALFRAPEKKKR